jgi:hypothetical protein
MPTVATKLLLDLTFPFWSDEVMWLLLEASNQLLQTISSAVHLAQRRHAMSMCEHELSLTR